MKEWQEQNPSDKYFFRKYNDICEEAPEKDSVEEDNDAEGIKLTSPLSWQKFLLVHQTSWQRRLLGKYGNDICLVYAICKTTRYSLPLFFLAVKTNVNYQVVATFVMQDEGTETTKEALEIIKEWNPD